MPAARYFGSGLSFLVSLSGVGIYREDVAGGTTIGFVDSSVALSEWRCRANGLDTPLAVVATAVLMQR